MDDNGDLDDAMQLGRREWVWLHYEITMCICWVHRRSVSVSLLLHRSVPSLIKSTIRVNVDKVKIGERNVSSRMRDK
jgi:hypothetical protein